MTRAGERSTPRCEVDVGRERSLGPAGLLRGALLSPPRRTHALPERRARPPAHRQLAHGWQQRRLRPHGTPHLTATPPHPPSSAPEVTRRTAARRKWRHRERRPLIPLFESSRFGPALVGASCGRHRGLSGGAGGVPPCGVAGVAAPWVCCRSPPLGCVGALGDRPPGSQTPGKPATCSFP